MIKKIWCSLLSNDKPQDKNVIWIDTSNSESFTLKLFRNGDWKPLHVVGTTRDMIERELTGYVTSHYHSYDRIINKPTTLTGYGITDCFNKTEIESLLNNKVTKVSGKSLSTNDFTNEDKSKLTNLKNYDDTQVRKLIAGKANLQHQHTVADITDFPKLYYDATAFFTSKIYPSDKYKELLEAVKAKKTIYAIIDEEGYISYVFFMSSTNSDGLSSRVLLTTMFADSGYLYMNTFVLQQSGMTTLRENITGKANKATTLAGYGIEDAYTKSEVDAALTGKQSTLTDTDGGYGQRVAELEKEGIASEEKLSELELSIHRKAFFVEDDNVFSNFIEEVYLIEENLPENATDLHFVYNSPNLLFYWTIDGVSSYISVVTSLDGIWRIPGKGITEPFGYVKINSNNTPTGYKISKNLNNTVYGLENSPSIAEAISVGSDFIPGIYNNADYKFWHEIYKNIHLETVSFESTENYYFTIGVTDTDIYIAVHSEESPNTGNTWIYKAVSVPKAQVTDTLSNVNIELLKSKTSITLNWLKILEAINKYNASASIKGQITIITQSKSSIYPFYNCGMNIKLLAGIKDIYIPNYDATKHYFIERFCFSDSKTTYQLRIGYTETEEAVAANQITILTQWFLDKSNYTDAQRKITQLIQNNGVKVLINIQECIDGGLNFEYYGDTVNPFSDASVVRLCTDSYSSKIIQDDTKTKADNAITSVKTINNQSIVGTGNIVIEGGVSDWDEIQNKPTFAPVATSGSYSDLSDKPTITEGAIVIDNVLDPTSPNPLSNSGVATAVNARSIIVSTIEQLKAAFTAGYKRIILDTNGSYIELSEQLNIPDRVIISAYNGYIKRAIGYDKWLICMGKGSQIYGLTIDGNKDNVNKTPIDPAIPLWSQVEEIRTYTPLSGTFNDIGNIIKDCKIVNGNTGIMYVGWHNVVENCVFENMASAAVHYSAGYHSSVKGCTFKNCCLEASVYEHSEGAVLWSNFCEDSLVENNYFDGCPEFAIGGLDSADNNNIVIQNNRINNTKGIGSVIYGTNSHNVVIRNNFITNCVYNASESYGIYFKRSAVANPPTAVNNNYIIEGNVVWGGGMVLYLRNSVIKNNTVINYSNAYNEPLKLVLDNCQINGNTFIEGNVDGYNFHEFTLRNCIFESNKISSQRRAFWLDGTERTIFRDNTIQCLEGAFYTNSSNNYGIELVNNVFCKCGAGSLVFAIPDGSKIFGNTFLGRSDDSVPVLSVSSTSKNVVVKDNRYIGSLNFEGTGENGCYQDGNYELIGDSNQLLTKHLFSVNNLTYSIQYVTPVMVGQPVILKITSTSGYTLPDTITVRYTKDGNTVTLTPGNIETYQGGTGDSLPWLITNDYLYDKETGYIYIPYVYDGLKIVASGVAEN